MKRVITLFGPGLDFQLIFKIAFKKVLIEKKTHCIYKLNTLWREKVIVLFNRYNFYLSSIVYNCHLNFPWFTILFLAKILCLCVLLMHAFGVACKINKGNSIQYLQYLIFGCKIWSTWQLFLSIIQSSLMYVRLPVCLSVRPLRSR